MRSARVAALFAAALLGTVPPISAQHALTGYSLTSWVERDGIPIGPVRAIAQDDVGYLWLATDASLLRFDGVRFATAASLGYDLPATDARSLLISRDRDLWIGFAADQGVRVIRQGRVESPGAPAGLRASVASLAEDESGTIWAATDKGLYSYQGGHWTRVPLATGTVDRPVATVYIDRGGTLWAGAAGGLFRRVAGPRFEPFGPSRAPVWSIAQDGHGRIWVTDPVAGFRSALEERGTWWGREGLGLSVFHDGRSNLWILTRGQGLWRVRMSELGASAIVETASVKSGLTANGIWTAFEDREGNLWVGTQLGLNRLTPHTVTPVELGIVRAVEAGDGTVWAGTARGLVRLTDGRLRRVRLPSALNTSDVRALFQDGDGTLWVGTNRAFGRLAGGRFTAVRLASGEPLTQVRSISADGRRGVWLVDTARGLFHWSHGRLDAVATPIDDTPGRPAFAYSDRHGRVWVALEGGRLGVIETGQGFRQVTAQDGFPSDTYASIDAIAEDEAGNVWIGGTGGLTRFADGRFFTLTPEMGLPGLGVFGIAFDDLGYVWLAVDDPGLIARLHPDEFTKAISQPGHRLQHGQFDTSRGVGGVPLRSGNGSVARAADGSLWFATGWGLTVVDPRAIAAQPPPAALPVRIEGAVADEGPLAATDGAVVPPRTSRLRIDYTALQLTSPTRVRFRYKLEGFDTDWVDVGTRRQAFFTNLPPLHYRFLVQAESGDGTWAAADAAWTFSIAPTFYQTRSFYVAVLGLLAFTVWGIWRLRVRHMRHEFALVLAERARLSREIHDTLLQNLAGVAIQCAAVANVLDPASPARARLVDVRRQIEGYVRDIRQAVWDLRAPTLETRDLAGALREFGAHATTGSGVRFDLTVTGKPRQMSAKVENEVLRVAQEGIRNAVQHASASRIHAELHFGPDALTLRVSDDGCGFDLAHQATDDRHFGLMAMKERANEIGGRLRIAMRPAGGTEVELVVPAVFQPAEA